MKTKWISVQSKLPEFGEKVLVWMRYRGYNDFEWNESEMEDPKFRTKFDYIEPNSKQCWAMGSAKGYEITHWARVTPAFE